MKTAVGILRCAAHARARWRYCTRAVLLAGMLALPGRIDAQNILSVPFTSGFIGTRASAAGTANNVLTFATLGIARTFFIQNSSTATFELQGNDIPGTLRFVFTDGSTRDIPASANWRNSGGSTYLIGILPRPTAPFTINYSGGSLQITDGAVSGGSSVGGYIAGYAGAVQTDGSSTSGNAAQAQVLTGLNSYLASVIDARPTGPVTVTALSTKNTMPTLTGTATLSDGDALSVVVNGTEYTTESSPGVMHSGTTWSLALESVLAVGTYDVTATITNSSGFTLSDATSSELVIVPVGGVLTVDGSFVATSRAYDATINATGQTSGLILVGVNFPHQVTIASVTLAFQSAAVGTAKTVVITGITLGGADAALYSVSMIGAPTATAAITPKLLTLGGSFTAADKTFDGNVSAVILTNALTLSGILSGDGVTLTDVIAAFANAAVGSEKIVSLAAASLTGQSAPNYALTLEGAPTATAAIRPKLLSLGGTFAASDKVYDGMTHATGVATGLTLVGVSSPDEVSIASVSFSFASSAVGSARVVTITGITLSGAQSAAYSVSLDGAPTTTARITPKPLTIGGGFTVASRSYDGTINAVITASTLALIGAVQPGDVALGTVRATFASPSVGNAKPVSLVDLTLSGPGASNYSVTLAGASTTAASITPRDLTVGGTFSVADRDFDGTTSATITGRDLLVLLELIAGDDVQIAEATAEFDDAAVGSGKAVHLTAVSLTGTAASNYRLVSFADPRATATIRAGLPPSPPRAVQLTAGNRSIEVSWTLSVDQGCQAITHHVVQYAIDGQAWTTGPTVSGTQTSVTLTPLTNNQPYRVRVTAVNTCGTSGSGDAANSSIPIGPTVGPDQRPVWAPVGTGVLSGNGTPQQLTPIIVQDTVLRIAAAGFTLELRAQDAGGRAAPIDETNTATLDRGGRAALQGNGFAPGTLITVYLFTVTGEPLLLGTVTVLGDGTFSASLTIPATLAPGDYTLQVNGIDASGTLRTVSLGVAVDEPLADLVLTSASSDASPTVGDTVTITITVTNVGVATATDVVIPRAFREPGFQVLSATPLHGTYDAAVETWKITRIAPGERAQLLLNVIVLPPVTSGSTTAGASANTSARTLIGTSVSASLNSPTGFHP